MSRRTPNEDPDRSPADRPSFELTARFDDAVEPNEVTVFPSGTDDPTTQWLTIETEYALPLDETV